MSQRNRTQSNKKPTMAKSNGTPPSANSLKQSNGNKAKSNPSDQNSLPLPDELTSINPSNPNDQSSSPNLNQFQTKPTGTSNVSASAKRKLTNDEVKFEKLNVDLKENVSGVGGLLLVLGHARQNEPMKADGLVVMQHSEKLCDDLTNLARKYESVYKGLNSLVQATVWGAVITDVATIALAIAANHGMSIPGLTPQVQQAA